MPLAVYLALRDRPGGGDRAEPGAAGRVGRACCSRLRDRWLRQPGPRAVTAALTVDARGPRAARFALDVALERRSPARCSAVLGPERGRQDDAAARARRPARPLAAGAIALDDLRPRRRRRPALFVPAERPAGRRGVPGLPAVPAPRRARQRRVRAAVARRAARDASRGWPPSDWLDRLGLDRARRPQARRSCRAARPSGSRWPARWPPSPALLLLDEPLAALDARTRLDVRAELRAAPRRRSPGRAVLVTHDPLEAMVLADRLARHRGRPGRPAGHAGRGRAPPGHRLRRAAGRPEPVRRPRRRRPGDARRGAAASWCPTTGSTGRCWSPYARRRCW